MTHSKARALAPGAMTLHAPIKRGDIPAVVDSELLPGTIAIIDGVFHSHETLSLTEIKRAISRGWSIVGCSSMGALRAVEAGPLGMKGFGSVYRWLRLFRVEDDDEVAQTVHPDTFEAITLAMVDVRWHVGGMRKAGIISPDDAHNIIAAMKSRYYPQRTRALLAELTERYARVGRRPPAAMNGADAPKQRDADALIRLLSGAGA